MKEHKITGRKGVVTTFTEQSCFTDELPSKGKLTTHPVVVDIFKRLMLKPPEEALKFEFKDEHAAKRFKYMLQHYREVRKLHVHVGHVNATVYIYNKPKETTNVD